MIDWMLWATIGSLIIALIIGVGLNRVLESRPKLQSYFGHIARFTVLPPNGNQTIVNAHAVVIRNVGRKAAIDFRLHHFNLPDFSIYVSVALTAGFPLRYFAS